MRSHDANDHAKPPLRHKEAASHGALQQLHCDQKREDKQRRVHHSSSSGWVDTPDTYFGGVRGLLGHVVFFHPNHTVAFRHELGTRRKALAQRAVARHV